MSTRGLLRCIAQRPSLAPFPPFSRRWQAFPAVPAPEAFFTSFELEYEWELAKHGGRAAAPEVKPPPKRPLHRANTGKTRSLGGQNDQGESAVGCSVFASAISLPKSPSRVPPSATDSSSLVVPVALHCSRWRHVLHERYRDCSVDYSKSAMQLMQRWLHDRAPSSSTNSVFEPREDTPHRFSRMVASLHADAILAMLELLAVYTAPSAAIETQRRWKDFAVASLPVLMEALLHRWVELSAKHVSFLCSTLLCLRRQCPFTLCPSAARDGAGRQRSLRVLSVFICITYATRQRLRRQQGRDCLDAFLSFAYPIGDGVSGGPVPRLPLSPLARSAQRATLNHLLWRCLDGIEEPPTATAASMAAIEELHQFPIDILLSRAVMTAWEDMDSAVQAAVQCRLRKPSLVTPAVTQWRQMALSCIPSSTQSTRSAKDVFASLQGSMRATESCAVSSVDRLLLMLLSGQASYDIAARLLSGRPAATLLQMSSPAFAPSDSDVVMVERTAKVVSVLRAYEDLCWRSPAPELETTTASAAMSEAPFIAAIDFSPYPPCLTEAALICLLRTSLTPSGGESRRTPGRAEGVSMMSAFYRLACNARMSVVATTLLYDSPSSSDAAVAMATARNADWGNGAAAGSVPEVPLRRLLLRLTAQRVLDADTAVVTVQRWVLQREMAAFSTSTAAQVDDIAYWLSTLPLAVNSAKLLKTVEQLVEVEKKKTIVADDHDFAVATSPSYDCLRAAANHSRQMAWDAILAATRQRCSACKSLTMHRTPDMELSFFTPSSNALSTEAGQNLIAGLYRSKSLAAILQDPRQEWELLCRMMTLAKQRPPPPPSPLCWMALYAAEGMETSIWDSTTALSHHCDGAEYRERLLQRVTWMLLDEALHRCATPATTTTAGTATGMPCGEKNVQGCRLNQGLPLPSAQAKLLAFYLESVVLSQPLTTRSRNEDDQSDSTIVDVLRLLLCYAQHRHADSTAAVPILTLKDDRPSCLSHLVDSWVHAALLHCLCNAIGRPPHSQLPASLSTREIFQCYTKILRFFNDVAVPLHHGRDRSAALPLRSVLIEANELHTKVFECLCGALQLTPAAWQWMEEALQAAHQMSSNGPPLPRAVYRMVAQSHVINKVSMSSQLRSLLRSVGLQ